MSLTITEKWFTNTQNKKILLVKRKEKRRLRNCLYVTWCDFPLFMYLSRLQFYSNFVLISF